MEATAQDGTACAGCASDDKEPHTGRAGCEVAGLIKRARKQYASDEIEIDDSPRVSRGEYDGDGDWVAAWVWVERRHTLRDGSIWVRE